MTVELKNDLAITGVLVSVDQFLNIKLDNIKVVDEGRYPHMVNNVMKKNARILDTLDIWIILQFSSAISIIMDRGCTLSENYSNN